MMKTLVFLVAALAVSRVAGFQQDAFDDEHIQELKLAGRVFESLQRRVQKAGDAIRVTGDTFAGMAGGGIRALGTTVKGVAIVLEGASRSARPASAGISTGADRRAPSAAAVQNGAANTQAGGAHNTNNYYYTTKNNDNNNFDSGGNGKGNGNGNNNNNGNYENNSNRQQQQDGRRKADPLKSTWLLGRRTTADLLQFGSTVTSAMGEALTEMGFVTEGLASGISDVAADVLGLFERGCGSLSREITNTYLAAVAASSAASAYAAAAANPSLLPSTPAAAASAGGLLLGNAEQEPTEEEENAVVVAVTVPTNSVTCVTTAETSSLYAEDEEEEEDLDVSWGGAAAAAAVALWHIVLRAPMWLVSSVAELFEKQHGVMPLAVHLLAVVTLSALAWSRLGRRYRLIVLISVWAFAAKSDRAQRSQLAWLAEQKGEKNALASRIGGLESADWLNRFMAQLWSTGRGGSGGGGGSASAGRPYDAGLGAYVATALRGSLSTLFDGLNKGYAAQLNVLEFDLGSVPPLVSDIVVLNASQVPFVWDSQDDDVYGACGRGSSSSRGATKDSHGGSSNSRGASNHHYNSRGANNNDDSSSGGCEEVHLKVQLDLQMHDVNVVLGVRVTSLEYAYLPSATLSLSGLYLRAPLYVSVRTMSEYPFVSAMRLSFAALPETRLDVSGAGLEVLSSVVGGDLALRSLVGALLRSYVAPHFTTVDMLAWLCPLCALERQSRQRAAYVTTTQQPPQNAQRQRPQRERGSEGTFSNSDEEAVFAGSEPSGKGVSGAAGGTAAAAKKGKRPSSRKSERPSSGQSAAPTATAARSSGSEDVPQNAPQNAPQSNGVRLPPAAASSSGGVETPDTPAAAASVEAEIERFQREKEAAASVEAEIERFEGEKEAMFAEAAAESVVPSSAGGGALKQPFGRLSKMLKGTPRLLIGKITRGHGNAWVEGKSQKENSEEEDYKGGNVHKAEDMQGVPVQAEVDWMVDEPVMEQRLAEAMADSFVPPWR